MSGSASLLCTSTGVWNGSIPECKCKLLQLTLTNHWCNKKYFLDAQCVSLPDDKNEGLKILRNDEASVLVPFRENVTLQCGNTGRQLRKTATSGFRQCVYDPKPVC